MRRTVSVVATLGLALAGVSGCGQDEPANPHDTLVIGVSGSNPGLSWLDTDGTFTGFDVELASYLARGLGWNEREVAFKAVTSDQREQVLVDGTVDLVVATYAITPERDEVVDFAGPYLVGGQDLLVPVDSTVTGPHGLDGSRVCASAAATDVERLRAPELSPGVELVEATGNAECVDLLLAGEVDAVTGDDAALAGYVELQPDRLRMVGSPFSTEYYGVGLPQGSPDVEVVDDLIRQALDDGTWQACFERFLGRSGWTPPPPVPG